MQESLDKDSSEVETLAKENSVLKLQVSDSVDELVLNDGINFLHCFGFYFCFFVYYYFN